MFRPVPTVECTSSFETTFALTVVRHLFLFRLVAIRKITPERIARTPSTMKIAAPSRGSPCCLTLLIFSRPPPHFVLPAGSFCKIIPLSIAKNAEKKYTNLCPMALARFTGTSFPICLYWLDSLPKKSNESGNVWIRAYSLTVSGRVSSGWQRSVCFFYPRGCFCAAGQLFPMNEYICFVLPSSSKSQASQR